ncbi:hypothetical protein C1645_779995 [Glomus cerebriforme]|uniref:Uncharacterized protein n=1 Tax=Glomus cerebriforme TaxID=658196 RepID=A0A397SU70_9GLOM|nr:hypothetical protein C1645_779995 [Glomus cerebriforme]
MHFETGEKIGLAGEIGARRNATLKDWLFNWDPKGTKNDVNERVENVMNVMNRMEVKISKIMRELNDGINDAVSEISQASTLESMEGNEVEGNKVEDKINTAEIKIDNIKKKIKEIEDKIYSMRLDELNRTKTEMRSIKDDMDYVNNIIEGIKIREYFSICAYLHARRDGCFFEVRKKKIYRIY